MPEATHPEKIDPGFQAGQFTPKDHTQSRYYMFVIPVASHYVGRYKEKRHVNKFRAREKFQFEQISWVKVAQL